MARQSFTDAAIVDALRQAAQRCGEPLSHSRYNEVAAAVGGPSSARIIQRFGSWREACAAAGVQAGAKGRQYASTWDEQAVRSAVAAYLRSEGCSGTYADYERWAKSADGRPSGATVRNVLGGWAAAKESAQIAGMDP